MSDPTVDPEPDGPSDSTDMPVARAASSLENQDDLERQAKGFGRAFWLTLITLLVVVGSLELYAALRLDKALHQWTETPSETATAPALLDQEVTQVAQDQREWRSKLIKESFTAAQVEYVALGKEMKSEALRELKETRSALIAQVPAWADWYYSVIGEYIRLGHLGAHAAGQGDFNDYIVEQLSERVFEPAQVSERLAKISQNSKDLFAERHKSIVAHLSRTLQHHQDKGTGWSKRDKEDFEAFQTYKCITNRKTPDLLVGSGLRLLVPLKVV